MKIATHESVVDMSEDGLDLPCFVSCSLAGSCLLRSLMVEVFVVAVVVVVFVIVVFVVVIAGNVEMLSFVLLIWLLVYPQRTKA